MSRDVGTIYYTVEADTARLLSSVGGAEKSLGDLGRQFGQTDKAAAISEARMNKTALAVRRVNQEAGGATSALSGLQKLLAGALTIQGVNSLVQMAEGYNEMAERVRMATTSQEEFDLVQQRLLSTANGTYRALSEAQELYIRTADSLRSMGYSTQAVLDITDSMSYAFVVNATSSDRANSAISAYTKSINKGRVESDAWESIIAAIPSVIDDVAAATARSAEEIRALGAAGKLTAQDLNKAFLQSLVENKEAANGMAVTVRDAFRSFSNSLSAYLGEANQASGATGVLATAIKGVGDNIDIVVSALLTLGAGALAKYVATIGASAIASARAMIATRAQAVEELRLAEAHAAGAAAALAKARANGYLATSASSAATAAAAHAAATARVAAAQAALVGVGSRLLAVLGGPVGLVAMLAAGAVGMVSFQGRISAATETAEQFNKRIEQANYSLSQLRASEFGHGIDQKKKEIEDLIGLIDKTNREAKLASPEGTLGKADLDRITEYQRRLAILGTEIQKASQKKEELLKDAPTYSDQEAERRLGSMRQELELAKKVGVERAKLQAIQGLGDGATEAQKAEAERLAASIYKLEQARDRAVDATKRQKSADTEFAQQQKANAAVIAELERELRFAALAGEELAAAKAAATLNKAATPEEVARVEALAKALSRVAERKKTVDAVGADPAAFIRGNVQPLSGGAFDDQAARYEAEAQAEKQRYADQLARLQQAQQAQIDVQGGYDALKEGMAQEHSDRMAQIERAKQQVMLSAGEQGFGAMADILRTASGEQSAIYRTMFAASKAFAIAQSLVSIQQGIAMAAANPFPANLAAMASVAAATASLVSNIASVSMAGGRQYGGPVDASKMYRINENGRPEVFQAANGQQYMLPNRRGEVVSNKDATVQQPQVNVTLNLIEDKSKAGQTEQRQQGNQVEISAFVSDIMSDGPRARVLQGVFGIRRRGK